MCQRTLSYSQTIVSRQQKKKTIDPLTCFSSSCYLRFLIDIQFMHKAYYTNLRMSSRRFINPSEFRKTEAISLLSRPAPSKTFKANSFVIKSSGVCESELMISFDIG